MGDKSKIEWTDASWTPIRARNRATGKVGWFCAHASDGCRFCYAEVLNRRLGTGIDYRAQDLAKIEVFLDEKMLDQPLRWAKPRKIFVCSMTDLFAYFVPVDWIDRVFAVMALAPQHTFLVLTKRPARMRDYVAADRMGYIEGRAKRMLRERSGDPGKPVMVGKTLAGTWPWPHVWLGVSVEDQARADERIPRLRETPAAVRFISAEPLLGPVDLRQHLVDPTTDWMLSPKRAIDWLIVGGESGPGARPMHPDWARSLRDQCQAAGVPFFFKQWRQVLELHRESNSSLTWGKVEATFKRLARERHPDHGGSDAMMAELNRARDDARRELGA